MEGFWLALDTSTARGSLALAPAGTLQPCLEREFPADRSASSTLFQELAALEAELKLVRRIVIGLGPGSYTGVRVAISAAMGLAVGNGAELVGITSLAALREPAEEGLTRYLVVGNARRQTYFLAGVNAGAMAGEPILEAPEAIAARLERPPFQDVPVFAFGEFLPGTPGSFPAFPSALRLLELAREHNPPARKTLEPIYLRPPHITEANPTKHEPQPLPPKRYQSRESSPE